MNGGEVNARPTPPGSPSPAQPVAHSHRAQPTARRPVPPDNRHPSLEDRFNTPWRAVAGAVYTAPTDARIYGATDFDVTDLMAYVRARRREGARITLTHVFTAAIARALAFDVPEMNAYMRRGRVIPRTTVDAMISVNIRGQEMSAIKITDAHAKPISVIAEEVRAKARDHRLGDESATMRNKALLSRIPWPLRQWAFRTLRWLTGDLGVEIPALGLSPDSFGSFMLSDIGSLGLTRGMAALLPAARLPVVYVLGRAEEKPAVVDGAIVPRQMVTLSGTFDHRLVDGAQGGMLSRAIARYLKRPEWLDAVPHDELATCLFPPRTLEVEKPDPAPDRQQ